MRVYVGTYAKYNDGNIFGKWLDIDDYSDYDEFMEACKELHNDEEDPEFMFQDWEYIPDNFIGECWICEDIFEVIQLLDDFNLDEDVFEEFCNDCMSGRGSVDWVGECQERYICKRIDLQDYLLERADAEMSFYGKEVPEFFRQYFNYQQYIDARKQD